MKNLLIICIIVALSSAINAEELPLTGATPFIVRTPGADILWGSVGSVDTAYSELGIINHNVYSVSKFLGWAGYYVSDAIVSDNFTVSNTGNYRIRISGLRAVDIIEGSTAGITGVSKAGGIMQMHFGLSNNEFIRDTIWETDFSYKAQFYEAAAFVALHLSGLIIGPQAEAIGIVNDIADHIVPKLSYNSQEFGYEITTELTQGTNYKWQFFVASNLAAGGVGIIYEAACYKAYISNIRVELEYLDAPVLNPPSWVSVSKGVVYDDYFIRICWQEVTEAEGYIIYRNTSNDPNNAVLLGTISGGDNTCHDDESVEQGITYYYWIKSKNITNNSVSELSTAYDWGYVSDGINITILPPINLTATSGDYSHKIRLTWEDVVSNPDIDGYEIWRSTFNSRYTSQKIAEVDDIVDPYYDNLTDTSAENNIEVGKTYYYWIKAKIDNPLTISDFSEGVSGRAGEPFPDQPYLLEIYPDPNILCGDSVVYQLRPKLYEEYNICVREGKHIIWQLYGCDSLWLEYHGDSGTYFDIVSTGDNCDSLFPILKFKGSEPCDATIKLGIAGHYYWDYELNLQLDITCEDKVKPIYKIYSEQYTTYSGKLEFDSSGSKIVVPKGGMFNTYTSIFETKNFTEICNFPEMSDSRTISPNGQYVFSVRDRWDYKHFLFDADYCNQDTVCYFVNSELVQWSDNSDLIACNTYENNRYGVIRIHDPITCEWVDTCITDFPDEGITGLDWRNNRLAAVGYLRQVTVWNTYNNSFDRIWTYNQSPCQSHVNSCGFNSDATKLAVLYESEGDNDCSSQNLFMFDVATGSVIDSQIIGNVDDHFSNICWSPDDTKLLLVSKGNFARIIDAQSFNDILDLDITSQGINGSYGFVWCDWGNNGLIAVRDDSSICIFSPFDITSPSIEITSDSVDFGAQIAYLTVNIIDQYSLDLDSIEISVNGAEYTNIFVSTFNTVFDSTTWSFSSEVPGISLTLNQISIRLKDRSGNMGINEIIIINTLIDVAGESEVILPEEFSVCQNYPNPFNPVTNIRYRVPYKSHVTIEIYNIMGQRVRTLLNAFKTVGEHQISWDGKNTNGKNVPSGIYFYQFKAGDFTDTKKMLLLK